MPLTAAELEIKKRACKDLFFFAKKVLRYDALQPVHEEMSEVFVQDKWKLNKGVPFTELDSTKRRLILWPRGHYKTTLNIADTLHWIVNKPDISILLMSGKLELATRMVYELKQHFTNNPYFQRLFPELCSGFDGKSDSFTVGNRGAIRREPTVSVSTIDSVKAGMHFDVIKCDDLVNEINSTNKEQIEKVIYSYQQLTPILNPGGYIDVIGTRWDYSDLYGWIIDQNDHRLTEKQAWTYNAQKERVLLLPEYRVGKKKFGFTLAELDKERSKNPYFFNCQYLNDPTPTEEQYFSEGLIYRHTLPEAHIPKVGRYVITWDLAFSQKNYSDFTVGAVGLFTDSGHIYVVDMIRGRFTPTQLVEAIIGLNKKYRPYRIGIENAGGSQLLQPALEARSREEGMYLPIDWMKTHPSTTKQERILGIEAMMKQDRMFLSAGLPQYKATLEEFTKFPKFQHDDIPDAISMLLEYRSAIDIQWRDNQVEMYHTPVIEGCELLGAGWVG